MTKTQKIVVAIACAIALVGGFLFTQYRHVAFPEAVLLAFDNASVEVTPLSYRVYSEEYLANLRREFELDSLVENCSNDYGKVQVITNWVHRLWQHDGNNQPAQSDPIFILREVAKGHRFRCVEYGVVISGCLQALGIEARTLNLKTNDVETRVSGAGHVGTEAYLPDIEKWVFIDGQWNAIAEAKGVPLNAVELQAAIVSKDPTLQFGNLSAAKVEMYTRWILPYLYYFDFWLDNKCVMLGPIGAKQPTIFQRQWPINLSLYTHSVEVFYAPPK